MLIEHSFFKNHSYNYRSEQEIETLTGFRSICKYSKEDAQDAVAANSTSVLKGRVLYIDTLFLDFDECESDANTFHKWLKTEDLCYERFDSGNRSVHFHLPIVLPPSPDAAYTCKHYVKFLTNNTADISYFHHAGLFRLTGTVHEKTGRPKVKEEEGGSLVMELGTVTPQHKFGSIDTDLDLLQVVMLNYESALFRGPPPGHRHMKIWQFSKDMNAAGLSFSTTLELCMRLNDTWHDPKTPEEVEKAVMGAFRY